MVRLVSLCLAVLLGTFVATLALAQNGPAFRGGIAYGRDPAQLLDLYLPATRAPARLVVFVHGGWRGHRGGAKRIAGPLTAAGYAIADVDFRPLPPNNVQGAVQDVADAAAFLLAHARDYNFDSARFAISGHSAGGNVAALLATDPTYLRRAGLDPARLAGALLLDGVYDVATNVEEYPTKLRYQVFGTNETSWRALSPTVHVASLPTHPRFCVAGEDTNPRMSQQTSLFEQALRTSRQTAETITMPGYKHGEMLKLFAEGPLAPFATACLNRAFGS